MSLIATSKSSDFPKVSEGVHIARCVRLIDLGTQLNERYGKYQPKVILGFEIPEETIEIEGVKKPLMISKEYTNNLGDKANLRKDLEAWRSKPFSDEEARGFDLTKLVGKTCMLTVIHKESNGNTYANISSIAPLHKSLTAPDQFNESLIYDINMGKEGTFEKLPEFQRAKILKAKELNTPQFNANEPHFADFEPVNEYEQVGEDSLPF